MQNPTQLASTAASTRASALPAVVFESVSLAFDDHIVLRDLSFELPKGGMTMLLGESGTGKSIVLKLILGLLKPDAGRILVNDYRVDTMPEDELLSMRADIGMVFQENALFDSLTVAENVGYRLYEESDIPEEQVRARVQEVLGFVGLTEFIDRMPSTLSGGQRRRVGIARAMASRPSLLLFDDPTTGLDPVIAASVDDQIVKLRDLEGTTSMMATHQIRDAYYIAEHQAVNRNGEISIEDAGSESAAQVNFMVLHQGHIHFRGSGTELLASEDPYLKEYLYRTLPPW
jgi:phospholipid/cholesterol/gamma-HCH transport system ATP-binding protein